MNKIQIPCFFGPDREANQPQDTLKRVDSTYKMGIEHVTCLLHRRGLVPTEIRLIGTKIPYLSPSPSVPSSSSVNGGWRHEGQLAAEDNGVGELMQEEKRSDCHSEEAMDISTPLP